MLKRLKDLAFQNESALFLMKEGYGYKTVTLKWCTPRATSNSVEMWPCSSAYRISPVDVTSRPSSCLTNFLLGGRYKRLLLNPSSKTNLSISTIGASFWNCREVVPVVGLRHTCWPLTEEKSFYTLC